MPVIHPPNTLIPQIVLEQHDAHVGIGNQLQEQRLSERVVIRRPHHHYLLLPARLPLPLSYSDLASLDA